jgi:hypothetical protein
MNPMTAIYKPGCEYIYYGILAYLQKPRSSLKGSVLCLYGGMELIIKARKELNDPSFPYEELDGARQAILDRLYEKRHKNLSKREDDPDEEELVEASIRMILVYIENDLKIRLDYVIPPQVLRAVQLKLYSLQERRMIASKRLDKWLQGKWPRGWEGVFCGTVDCQQCRTDYLVIGYHSKPFCFSCSTCVDAAECKRCSRTYLKAEGCCRLPEEEIVIARGSHFCAKLREYFKLKLAGLMKGSGSLI